MLIGILFLLGLLAVLALNGVIGLNRSELVLSTESQEALYDGMPLTNHRWQLKKGSLRTGHSMKVTVTGTQTAVGQTKNTLEVVITDELGVDVTGDYQIQMHCGTLTVNPRIVQVDVYEGGEYTVSSEYDGLVRGHKLVVSGTPRDNVTAAVYDRNGSDVTRNYQLIIKTHITETAGGGGGSDDGPGGGSGGGNGPGGGSGSGGGAGGGIDTSGGLGGGGGTAAGGMSENPALFLLYAETEEALYLKLQSYGSFNGKSWEAATPYDVLVEGRSAFYLTSNALAACAARLGRVQIKSLCGQYALPYYAITGGEQGGANDVVCIGDASVDYIVDYYAYSDALTGVEKSLRKAEELYRSFVYEQYLSIDQETLAYMQGIIAAQGFSADSGDIIDQVAAYIQSAAAYNLQYDTALDEADNIVIAFLDQYKEGVCRHYASAATLLYRALGIPARYTVGAYAQTEAGEWVSVGADKAHAWVEVYCNGIGWVQVEVTGSAGGSDISGGGSGGGGGGGGGGGSGRPNETPKLYKVSPVAVEKMYDGEPLYPIQAVKGLDDLLKLGYTYKVVISGSRTELGLSESIIEQIFIFDANGQEVTDTINLKLETGRIHVYMTELYFESNDHAKVYDGQEVESGHLTGGWLVVGHTCQITSTAKRTAGYHLNTYQVTILDENGENVTDHYKIVKNYGHVIIHRATITVKAGDAEKVYDGLPLTCDEIAIIEGALMEGDYIIVYQVLGSQTEVGRSDNVVVDIMILNAAGEDVTGCYEIILECGRLRVTLS
jgi:hypothetical protein